MNLIRARASYDMQQAAQLMRLLAGLPGAQREAFVLQQEAGRSVEEIAAAVVVDGVPPQPGKPPVPAAKPTETESSRESAVADQTAASQAIRRGRPRTSGNIGGDHQRPASLQSYRLGRGPDRESYGGAKEERATTPSQSLARISPAAPPASALVRELEAQPPESGWKKSLDCASRAEPRKPANCSSSSENAIRIIPCPLSAALNHVRRKYKFFSWL